MRVVVFAQDECAAQCLPVLAAKKYEVFGVVNCRTKRCPLFLQRCSELGFECISTSDTELLRVAVEGFKAGFALCVPLLEPAEFVVPEKVSSCSVKLSNVSHSSTLWPEFFPVWEGLPQSKVALLTADGGQISNVQVPVVKDDTALSLRVKHMSAALDLLGTFLDQPLELMANAIPAAEIAYREAGEAPQAISLDWSEEDVDRFVRAMKFPPHDPAVVKEPLSGDAYFIESMPQWQSFRTNVLQEEPKAGAPNGKAQYVADTHWYSNVGGSIVKLGDRDIHAPRKAVKENTAALIPGAAVGLNARKLRMNEPLIGMNAGLYCATALSSGWIGVEGPYVKKFEAQLAQICGCVSACAVQSGTAALYGAMKALGVAALSHHVLCPSFTCAACADAVVHAGGTPIPVDCELDTFGLSFEAVKAALESDPNVVGVVIAPCYGVPARDFLKIAALCKSKGLWLCEDNCETYGATMMGASGPMPVGSLGTMCVISTRSEKMIGVGEGGAILSNDAQLVSKAKWWCSRAPTRGGGLWRVYEHEGVGQNFRMPEMLAAVGCGAAEMLPVMIERKRMIHGWYQKHMKCAELSQIRLQQQSPEEQPVWWINAALLPEGLPERAETIGHRLMDAHPNIEIRPGFFPLDQMAIFKPVSSQPCPNSALLYERLLCLPSSAQLSESDVQQICSALQEALLSVQ